MFMSGNDKHESSIVPDDVLKRLDNLEKMDQEWVRSKKRRGLIAFKETSL